MYVKWVEIYIYNFHFDAAVVWSNLPFLLVTGYVCNLLCKYDGNRFMTATTETMTIVGTFTYNYLLIIYMVVIDY